MDVPETGFYQALLRHDRHLFDEYIRVVKRAVERSNPDEVYCVIPSPGILFDIRRGSSAPVRAPDGQSCHGGFGTGVAVLLLHAAPMNADPT